MRSRHIIHFLIMGFKNFSFKSVFPSCFRDTRSSRNVVCRNRSVKRLCSSRIAPDLEVFTMAEVKAITHNFSLSYYLGEGGFGPVYKGFIDEKVRPGYKGLQVAVKVLDLDGEQGHTEWLVGFSSICFSFLSFFESFHGF